MPEVRSQIKLIRDGKVVIAMVDSETKARTLIDLEGVSHDRPALLHRPMAGKLLGLLASLDGRFIRKAKKAEIQTQQVKQEAQELVRKALRPIRGR